MLQEGKIPMNDAEHEAIEALLDGKNIDRQTSDISYTRRDPNESGPIVVEIDGAIYVVEENGVIV